MSSDHAFAIARLAHLIASSSVACGLPPASAFAFQIIDRISSAANVACDCWFACSCFCCIGCSVFMRSSARIAFTCSTCSACTMGVSSWYSAVPASPSYSYMRPLSKGVMRKRPAGSLAVRHVSGVARLKANGDSPSGVARSKATGLGACTGSVRFGKRSLSSVEPVRGLRSTDTAAVSALTMAAGPTSSRSSTIGRVWNCSSYFVRAAMMLAREPVPPTHSRQDLPSRLMPRCWQRFWSFSIVSSQ